MTELTGTYNIFYTVWCISDFADMSHIIQVHMINMMHRYGDMTDIYGMYVHTVQTYVWQQR